MASWDVVEVDFGGDETGNFGPRLESGSALYQVDTTAVITSHDEVTENPIVRAAAIADQVCVAAGPHVSFLGDEGHKYFITLAFESEIDILAWHHTGDFIVIGENNGSIHFLEASTQKPLFSKTIVPSTTPGKSTFAHIGFLPSNIEDNVCDVLVLTSGGQLYCLNNLNIAQLQNVSDDGAQVADTLTANLKVTAINVAAEHTEGATSSACVFSHGKSFIVTAGHGNSTLCLWDRNNTSAGPIKRVHSKLTGGILKIAAVQNGQYLLVLSEQHTLSLWHTASLTILRHWTETSVSDFVLLEPGQDAHSANQSWSGVKVALTVLPTTEDSTSLLICSLPSLTPEYSLQLSSPTILVNIPPQQEAIYVVEGVSVNEDSDIIDTLRLRSLTEGQPDLRYSRLLHKHQFDAAETLAQQFGLDIELVYKVKANWLLDCLAPWWAENHEPVDIAKAVADLQACLALIKDDGHVVDCCLKATPPSMETTWELFNYAKDRLSRFQCTETESDQPISPTKEEEAVRAVLMTQVLEAMHRLTTFHMAFGPVQFTSWDQFQKADMLTEFICWLSSGAMSIAFCIWRRHWSEFDDVFSVEVLEDILANIPETVPSDVLRPWLSEDFIPYVMRKLPESLDKVAVWLEQRTRTLEILEKEHWPKNGLLMAELLQNTCVSVSQSTCRRGLATPKEFSTQACCLSVAYSQVNNRQKCKAGVHGLFHTEEQLPGSEESDAFAHLHMLIMELQDLMNLQSKYKCVLTLDEYSQETTESITYRMLDRVSAVELIPAVIKHTVRPYMKEHHLNEDKMLFQYIGDLVERQSKDGSYGGESLWEAKAITVIQCISNPEYKCKAILDAMKRAYVPWSEDMENLVKEGLALNHPRVAELKKQCTMIELSKLLIRYDLQRNKVYTEETAKRLVQYIIREDRETAVADALAAITYFKKLNEIMVYKFRLIFLVQGNRVEEAIQWMKSLPPKTLVTLGCRFVCMAIEVLDTTTIFETEKSQREKLLFAYAARGVIQLILPLEELERDVAEDFSWTLIALEKINALQVEFGEFITYKDFHDASFLENILSSYIIKFFTKPADLLMSKLPPAVNINSDKKPSKQKQWSYNKVYRLANLLNVSKAELDGQLAIAAAQQGQIETAIKRAMDLHKYFPGHPSAVILYQVAYQLLMRQAEDRYAEQCAAVPNLPARVHELCRLALTTCEPGLLGDCLELCKNCRLALAVASQTDAGDYGLTVRSKPQSLAVDKRDPYEEWTFNSFHQEDGLVLDWAEAVPLAYSYGTICLPTADCKKRPAYIQSRIQGSIGEQGGENNGPSTVEKLRKRVIGLVQLLQENNQSILALQYALDVQGANNTYLASTGRLGHTAQEKPDTEVLETNKELHETGINIKPDPEVLEANKKVRETLTAEAAAINAKLLTGMLIKMFTQRYCDHNLALCCLMALPKEIAVSQLKKLIQMAGHHYRQVMNVATAAIDFAELHNEPKLQAYAVDIKERAHCGHKLTKLKISFDAAYKENTDDAKMMVLTQLAQHPAVDVDFLKQFCRDLMLDEDVALLMYIEHQLLRPLRVSEDGDCRSASRHAGLQGVQMALSQMNNTANLPKKLNAILLQLSPYDHERIQFVVNNLDKLSPSESTVMCSRLLEFLILYQRQSKPSEYELNYSRESEEDMIYNDRSLCPLSKTRLPFHPLIYKDPLKIIMPELSEDSVTTWLPIVHLLRMPADQLYVMVIRNMVNQHVEARKAAGGLSKATAGSGMDKSKCNWDNTDGIDLKLFQSISHILHCLSSCETAMACAMWVVNELSMGTEKVLALQSCADMAEKWVQACPQEGEERVKAQAAYVRFSDAWRRLSTEQVLFQHDLGNPHLLALAPKPKDLIVRLYEHPSIQQRTTSTLALSSLPDIHSAVDKIATLNQLNLSQMRLKLFERWLPSALSSKQDEADMTMTMNLQNMSIRSEEDIAEDEINLNRVSYLLQYGSLNNNTLFLLNYVFKQSTTKITTMCRVRALRCLFSLVGKNTIEKLACVEFDVIKNCLCRLLYMAELENLHINHTQDSFTKCNKDGLVRGIWRNHRHEKRAVRLVADLCLDYNIIDAQLWNSILQQLYAFDMLDYLRHVLMALSAVPALWPVPSIQPMWRAILIHPLTSVVAPLTEWQEAACLQSVALLHRCPGIMDKDLLCLAKHYVHLEMMVCALACVLLLPRSKQREVEVSGLLEGEGLKTVLLQLNDWTARGIQVPSFEQVQKAVYQYVDEKELFDQLVGTSHFSNLAISLLKNDNINNLLVYSICHDRLMEATLLLSAYQQMYPRSEFAQQAKSSDDMAELRVYLQLHGLESQVEGHLPKVVEESILEVADNFAALSDTVY